MAAGLSTASVQVWSWQYVSKCIKLNRKSCQLFDSSSSISETLTKRNCSSYSVRICSVQGNVEHKIHTTLIVEDMKRNNVQKLVSCVDNNLDSHAQKNIQWSSEM